MINDYFFDVRLSEKYDKIAEEKFIFTLCSIKKNSRNMTKI